MEKYRASKNNFEEIGEQTQDEKSIESNKKLIDSAKEIGKKVPVPQVQAAAHAIDKVDKFTGGAATNAIAKGVNDMSKINPAMNQIQNASNKLNDTGVSDTLNKGTTLKSGGGLSSNNKSSGILSDNIMSKFKFAGSMKLKLIIAASAFILLIFMTMVTAIASKDNANLDITNRSEMARKSAASADVMKALEEVANWYIENVAVYDQTKYVESPFASAKVRADCTGFAVAYMSYVAGTDVPDSYSGEMIYPDGNWAKSVESLGWIAYTSDEIGELQPGDVLISHKGVLYSTKGQHAEIYVDESHTFGWGSVKSSYPTNLSITKSEFDGHVHFMDNTHDYITIYRYAGAVNTKDMNIKEMKDSSFNHGTKPKENQKYIMLHDTEMAENAETVVNSWKNSGNGVAAHFVIDRDGTIIQAVDLDIIAHHAGYGGPGNYDSKFNVGNNDGQGNGDDLVGTQPLSGYTSYGMNSYSIGIEMCHVNGEEYPIELLKSLDKVIAYIDSYYGFKSEIIDHKAWRPSNSDTDAKFSTYLNNYKSLRHY